MRFKTLSLVLTMLAGCSREGLPVSTGNLNGNQPPDLGGAPFPQPPGTAAVSFGVDDRANAVYGDGDLVWMGAMTYDPVTRIASPDPLWAHGDYDQYPPLYDDGPWDTGGHEPLGAVAGDHQWGVTVFVVPEPRSAIEVMYGLADRAYGHRFGYPSGWLWSGMNGTFTVAPGDTTPVQAAGMALPKFGSSDAQLTLDTSHLDTCGGQCTWDTSVVRVKSSATTWIALPLADAGGGRYVVTLSDVVGQGHPLDHSGLLARGDRPEVMFLLGPGDGKEYKDQDDKGLTAGVTVAVGPKGGPFQQVALSLSPTFNATFSVP